MVNANVQSWSGPAERVDLILASHVMYHLSDNPQKFLVQAMEWLRPGGLFLICHAEENPLSNTGNI